MPGESFQRFVADQGHAERLHVTRTPTLFLVRAPDQVSALSEGLVTDDGLLERMILVAHEAGWITQEEFESTRAKRPGSSRHPPRLSSYAWRLQSAAVIIGAGIRRRAARCTRSLKDRSRCRSRANCD